MMILNWIYQMLWRVAPPVIRHYLRQRAQKNADYMAHWAERFGEPFADAVQGAIWVHAVSVGETRAAQPLIAALKQRFPDAPILLTQMTPTGRATAQTLFPDAQCRYLPYDRVDWVRQFVQEHRPMFGVLMETEIWVNLMNVCAVEQIPLFLANARLSPKSRRGYGRVRGLVAPALASLSGCFAQSEADARRLQEIGVVNALVCGNTKYDSVPSRQMMALAAQFRQWLGNRRVFLAASTRECDGVDEADLVIQAWQRWLQVHGDDGAILVVVPRHPERFQAAFVSAQQCGLTVQKRSEAATVLPETQVWIGDSMGEMFAYYGAADVVFVGGSLVDTGCQNIIEPMSCGKPVLFGTSVYNFQAACDEALAFGAAKQIQHADALVAQAQAWLAQPDEYTAMAKRAECFVAQHRGASERIATNIAETVAKTSRR